MLQYNRQFDEDGEQFSFATRYRCLFGVGLAKRRILLTFVVKTGGKYKLLS